MPKVTRKKIGLVLIKFLPNRKQWRASFRDRDGCYARRLLWTSEYGEAAKMAEQINSSLLEGKGYLPSRKRTTQYTIKQALEESLQHAGGNGETKRDYVHEANRFLKWLEDAYPNIQTWGQLLPVHVKDYLLYCQRKGYAYDTIRQRLYVVRMTARYMSSNYPERYRLITQDLRLKRDRKPEIRYLTQEQLQGYLGFLRERYPDIYPIAMLQGLAGLRILEAINLRDQDIDFPNATITITETPRHKPKTLDSYRVIPIARPVVEAIQAAIKRRKIVPVEGYIFVHCRGEPWSMDGICGKLKRCLRDYAQVARNPSIAAVRPHELRATFVTMMRCLGVGDRSVKRYIGHTLGDVLGEHYEATPIERLRVDIVRTIEERIGDKTDQALQSDCITPKGDFVSPLTSSALA